VTFGFRWYIRPWTRASADVSVGSRACRVVCNRRQLVLAGHVTCEWCGGGSVKVGVNVRWFLGQWPLPTAGASVSENSTWQDVRLFLSQLTSPPLVHFPSTRYCRVPVQRRRPAPAEVDNVFPRSPAELSLSGARIRTLYTPLSTGTDSPFQQALGDNVCVVARRAWRLSEK